jgi:hypothetical protein
MSANAAAKQLFANYARVTHPKHGDGTVRGKYGSRISVDFDTSHIMRVAPESLDYAAPMPHEAVMKLCGERDAKRDRLRIEAQEWLAKQSRRDASATIIPFPTGRIVRRIEHGAVVHSDVRAAPQSAA